MFEKSEGIFLFYRDNLWLLWGDLLGIGSRVCKMFIGN